jgi:hypothetical protein
MFGYCRVCSFSGEIIILKHQVMFGYCRVCSFSGEIIILKHQSREFTDLGFASVYKDSHSNVV